MLMHFILGAITLLVSADDGQDIVDQCQVQGGLVVHLGCKDGTLTASLGTNESFLVQGLDVSTSNVEQARKHIRSLGRYGRVSVDTFDGTHLPYVDNLVNLVVADDLGDVSMVEVMRVLAPLGVACINGRKTVKPWPKDIDEWTHFLHGSDNNSVVEDTLVGPPRRLQWLCGPAWARHHDELAFISAMVSARGRIFYIIDEAPTTLVHLPPKWTLVARDGFSGVLLWRRSIDKWESHLRYFRTGPTHLPRRLVAVDDVVYATLGYGKPVSVLNAATGETVTDLAGTENAEEIVCHDGLLLVVINTNPDAPSEATVATKRGGKPVDTSQKRLVVLDLKAGETLWSKDCAISTQTLAAQGDRLFYHSGSAVTCADLRTGSVRWQSPPLEAKGRSGDWYAPTLVATDKAVLLASGRAAWAVSTQDGQVLWTSPVGGGFLSPSDVFVVGEQVWLPDTNHPFPVYEARDLSSGEVVQSVRTKDVWGAGHHHRCYRNKSTERFLITSRRGVEFIDMVGGEHSNDIWTRGICGYGMMPCNGLLYAPPHPCMCYAASKLNGFYAFAPQQDGLPKNLIPQERLMQGPAYARAEKLVAIRTPPQSTHGPGMAENALWTASGITDNDEWPTFRHDPARSGSTGATVPDNLRVAWRAELGAKLSAPVCAGGRILVALTDQHAVQALDAATGSELWTFTTGGRIDSPPTIYGDLAVFGSADGSLYCLDANDGTLVWRFFAAPADRRGVSYGRLESAWPVHGSPLIHPFASLNSPTGAASGARKDPIVYVAAGRTGHLDGGMHVYGIQLTTGRQVYKSVIDLHSPNTNAGVSGLLSDVPVANGTGFNIRHNTFNERCELLPKDPLNSLSGATGLLDDSIDHRSFWTLGRSSGKKNFGNPSIPEQTGDAPYAKMFAFDADSAYGYRVGYDMSEKMTPAHHQNFQQFDREKFPRGGLVFAVENAQTSKKNAVQVPIFAKGHGKERRFCRWKVETPLQVRAMLLANDRLCIAGWEDSNDPDAVQSVLDNRQMGKLVVMSTKEGEVLAVNAIESPPVWDGMIAAGGRLFVALKNGSLVCMEH